MMKELEKFESILLDIATKEKTPEVMQQYSVLRKRLLGIVDIKKKLPEWVSTCRDGASFWEFIKLRHQTYVDRRIFIRESLNEAFLYAENQENSFALDQLVFDSHLIFNSEHIQLEWKKAIERRSTDPDGAMTLAKTMLESVCKHILDELQIAYKDEKELTLQKLYKTVSKELKLSPSQHTENEFKKILGGCSSIIDGLASIRGLVSDAHGTGKIKYKIAQRHSVLAINSAFTLIIFLADTYKARQDKLQK